MSKRNAHDFKCAQMVARINRDAHQEYREEDEYQKPPRPLTAKEKANLVRAQFGLRMH